MIKVRQSGHHDVDIREIVHSLNFSEEHYPVPVIQGEVAFTTAAPAFPATNIWGALAVDRNEFRRIVPDRRWYLYAAGLVHPHDANTATVALQYLDNSGTLTSIGTVTQAGNAYVKRVMGPFDLFTVVNNTEAIPVIALTAQKSAGANGSLFGWTMWVRYLSSTA